mmetsp:Transcript_23293/g.34332  ORF Transcript_23293/g.34332 Transcript_23293/m.34332 type:complete len:137 (-) Transcript_23293:923-1333(-)
MFIHKLHRILTQRHLPSILRHTHVLFTSIASSILRKKTSALHTLLHQTLIFIHTQTSVIHFKSFTSIKCTFFAARSSIMLSYGSPEIHHASTHTQADAPKTSSFSPPNTLAPWVYEYKIQPHDTENSPGTLHSLYP